MYDITNIIIYLIGLLVAVTVSFIIPFIKKKTNTEEFETIKSIVITGVYAAEQIYGSGKGKKKKEYVTNLLKSKGVTYNEPMIDALIESSVKELTICGGEY